MENVISICSFKLNDGISIEEWNNISKIIGERFKSVDGFISRDVAIDDDKNMRCIIKWENAQKRITFNNIFENQLFEKSMVDFKRIVDMKTWKEELLTVI